MAEVAKWYGLGAHHFVNGDLDWDDGGTTVRVALLNSGYSPNQDTDEFWSGISSHEVSGTGYTAGGKALTSRSRAYSAPQKAEILTGADVVWSASSITGARYAVLYKDTGTPSTSFLVGYVDFGADQSSLAGVLTLHWDTGGILRLELAA